MSRLFEQTEINGLETANRFVRSATWEGMATQEGAVTPRLVDLMSELAAGGVGLIISSHAYVKKVGQAFISMSRPFIREPDLIKRWASGDRTRARCLSDNQCFGPGMAGEGVYCVTKKQEEGG